MYKIMWIKFFIFMQNIFYRSNSQICIQETKSYVHYCVWRLNCCYLYIHIGIMSFCKAFNLLCSYGEIHTIIVKFPLNQDICINHDFCIFLFNACINKKQSTISPSFRNINPKLRYWYRNTWTSTETTLPLVHQTEHRCSNQKTSCCYQWANHLLDQVIVLPVLGGCPTWSSLCGLWESVLYSHYWAGRQADSHVLRQPGRADICVHAQLERGDNSRNFIVLVWQFVCNCVRMYCKFIDCQTVWTRWYSSV